MPCAAEIASTWKPRLRSESSKLVTRSKADGRRPRLTLMAISHAVAALTRTSSDPAIRSRARLVKAESSVAHQISVWVSRRRRTDHCHQRSNSSGGSGSKNSGPNLNFPFNQPTVSVFVGNRNQAHNRFFAARDHNVLTPASIFDEAREVSFCGMDGYCFH